MRTKQPWRLLVPAVLLAATAVPRGQGSSADDRPFVVAATIEQDMVYLTDPLTVRVETRNNPGNSHPFQIVSLTVRFPSALLLAGRCPAASDTASGVDRRQPCDVPIPIPDGAAPGVAGAATLPASDYWLDPIGAFGFRSREYRVLVQVKYGGLDPTTKDPFTREFDVPLRVNPKAPLMSVVAGGIVGVLLVLAFTLFGDLGSGKRRNSAARHRRTQPLEIFSVFVYGALATTLAILLLTVTNTAGFPISVSIADSTGGMVLGLFFKPVAAFIQTRIAAKGNAPKSQPLTAQVADE